MAKRHGVEDDIIHEIVGESKEEERVTKLDCRFHECSPFNMSRSLLEACSFTAFLDSELKLPPTDSSNNLNSTFGHNSDDVDRES